MSFIVLIVNLLTLALHATIPYQHCFEFENFVTSSSHRYRNGFDNILQHITRVSSYSLPLSPSHTPIFETIDGFSRVYIRRHSCYCRKPQPNLPSHSWRLSWRSILKNQKQKNSYKLLVESYIYILESKASRRQKISISSELNVIAVSTTQFSALEFS